MSRPLPNIHFDTDEITWSNAVSRGALSQLMKYEGTKENFLALHDREEEEKGKWKRGRKKEIGKLFEKYE